VDDHFAVDDDGLDGPNVVVADVELLAASVEPA